MKMVVEKEKITKFVLFSVLLLMLPGLSKVVLINSQDWKDVYGGILYANYYGYNVFYTNSPNPAGLFNILPKDEIVLVESKSKPFISNLEAQLKAKNYIITNKIEVSNGDIELKPDSISDSYLIVEEDYPYLSIPAGAYAKATNSWVLIVNDDNLDDVVKLVSNAKKVILVGKFKRNIYEALKPYATEEITGNSKYEIAKEIGDKFMDVKPTKNLIITEGKYLERELLYGSAPVLFVGTNFLPKETKDFIFQHNIKTVVAIGSQLTYVGEKIREVTNKKVAVFVKFGQSTPGINPSIYALSFFPLPVPKIGLSVVEAVYDPSQKKLLIHFKNTGETGVYEFTTFRVVDEEGKEVASGGDEDTIFLGLGEELWRSYDVTISDFTKNLSVEVYTSYGEDPENMISYLTESGKFGPPLSLPLKIKEVKDSSQIEVLSVVYNKNAKAFIVKVKNTGNTKAVVVIKLIDVKIHGIKRSLSSEPVTIRPGEEREVVIRADLDEADLLELYEVKLEADYGENTPVKFQVIKKNVEITSGLMKYIIYGGVVLGIIVIIVLFLKIKGKRGQKKLYHYKKR